MELCTVLYRSLILAEARAGWPCTFQSEARSGQIEAVGATCGPSRPKRLVVVTQGQGCRPATGSRLEPQATNLRVPYSY